MSKKNAGPYIPVTGRQHKPGQQFASGIQLNRKMVKSLLDVMEDGREYASLVDCVADGLDVKTEFRRAITEYENLRGRPLLCYLANTIKPAPGSTSIDATDDIPFAEMVAAVPAEKKEIDLMIVTGGGSGQQVAKFVNALRPRFEKVSFVLPSVAMSAGTIWAMSGNEIWMDERAYIGPIDPQVPGRDGNFLPAQGIFAMIQHIQEKGQKALDQGKQPDWADIQLLSRIDGKELGNAIRMSQYSVELVKTYLKDYKFKSWTNRLETGEAISEPERLARAELAANKLCDHAFWKSHGNGISRQDARTICKILIEHPESVPGFSRAIRRIWALGYYFFDQAALSKIFISNSYAIFRTKPKSGA